MGLDSKLNLNELTVNNVKAFLIKEYGYLLPQIENVTSLELKNIDLNSLNYHKKLMERLILTDLNFYDSIDSPIIVLKKEHHLIDGYHRVALALKLEKKHILAIVLD